jgi:primosomal protein N' (replication factor Y)
VQSRPVSTPNFAADTRRAEPPGVAPLYAEVALPVRLARTFTYRLPLALRSEARVGARVLVPFGRKLATAYIVALHEELDAATELEDAEIKDAEELLDAEPLLTPEVLEITRWISEYYAAPWGEVLKAALPAGLNATIEQVVTVTPEGLDELARLPARRATTPKGHLLRLASLEGSTTVREAARELGQARATKAARELERSGWITLAHRARSAPAKAKRRKAVRLLPVEQHAAGGARALTAAQARVVEALIASGGEMYFAELLDAAGASVSSIQTLERRGILEVFVREVRRDPLAGATLPEASSFELTDEQAHALREIEAALARGEYAAFLLHGVTGSGKTEIYIRAMRAPPARALRRRRRHLPLVSDDGRAIRRMEPPEARRGARRHRHALGRLRARLGAWHHRRR